MHHFENRDSASSSLYKVMPTIWIENSSTVVDDVLLNLLERFLVDLADFGVLIGWYSVVIFIERIC
jgi:hypothetical protein